MKVKRSIPQAVFESRESLMASRLGHEDACRELDRMHPLDLNVSNPNHPLNDGIFGYEKSAFLKRQYK